jgi:sugar (pentulose or hexulose) kinase
MLVLLSCDDIWVGGGAINNGGIVYSWLNDLLNDDTHGRLIPSVSTLISSFLTGERSPNWNAQARGFSLVFHILY